MFKALEQRKEKRKELEKRVKQEKEQRKIRKNELRQLPEDERKKERLKDRQLQKDFAKRRKVEIKALDKKERKAAIKENKIYQKIKNRPRRITVGSMTGVLALLITINMGPFVVNLFHVFTGTYITLVTNSSEALTAREYGEMVAKEISDEGIVLLKNEDHHLPLQQKQINVFSIAALDIRYGGGGSGTADTSRAVNLFQGLEAAGINYNEELYQFYQDVAANAKSSSNEKTGLMQIVGSLMGMEVIDEPEISYLSDEIIEQAKSYSDHALIVIASDGAEASDLAPEQLQLTANKRALIEKVSENFDHVTLVINAGNTLELGFVNEYPSIKSVLWIGTPGPYGTLSLGEVLAGTLNPSGRITSTYAYDISSAPASVNFGDYSYENLDKAFINYQEGIYVGYRYYETYFQNDDGGYENTVLYPFGYGLSFTDFEWKVIESDLTEEVIKLSVAVTNVGSMAGKDVVQAYYSTPYTEGGIEKAAIELATFKKTSLLAPGETETLHLAFDTREMASYDMDDQEAYILEEGIYTVQLGKNVREIIEQIEFELDKKIIYEEDSVTGTAYKNHFNNAKGELNYLSRSDWTGTFPTNQNLNYKAPQYVLDELIKEVEASSLPVPEFGVENGIQLGDLKGLEFTDPKWEAFLDQFTYEEMKQFVTNAAYKTLPIDRLGVPQTLLMDGPAGFSYFFKKVKAASYPTQVVLASTWNEELAYRMGEAIGNEARVYGIQGWYAPGMNIHRTPQGGRNFEYFSEDPILTGKMASEMIKGAQDQGIIAFMKHFALNDQETNARSGILVWANEQSIREIYLKPFEMAVKEASVKGAMSSFSYIGPTWAGANPRLLNDILRDEWGFKGFVTSDAVFSFMEAQEAIIAGNDLMLDVLTPHVNDKRMDQAYKQDPAGIAHGLRNSIKNVLYTLLETYLFE